MIHHTLEVRTTQALLFHRNYTLNQDSPQTTLAIQHTSSNDYIQNKLFEKGKECEIYKAMIYTLVSTKSRAYCFLWMPWQQSLVFSALSLCSLMHSDLCSIHTASNITKWHDYLLLAITREAPQTNNNKIGIFNKMAVRFKIFGSHV